MPNPFFGQSWDKKDQPLMPVGLMWLFPGVCSGALVSIWETVPFLLGAMLFMKCVIPSRHWGDALIWGFIASIEQQDDKEDRGVNTQGHHHQQMLLLSENMKFFYWELKKQRSSSKWNEMGAATSPKLLAWSKFKIKKLEVKMKLVVKSHLGCILSF